METVETVKLLAAKANTLLKQGVNERSEPESDAVALASPKTIQQKFYDGVPGDYYCHCIFCFERFIGAKRDPTCPRCALLGQGVNDKSEPKVALCMIAGNEASVILRCLNSAAAAFDSLCLVQAVGEQDADETLDIARAWCLENGKDCIVDVYRNKIPGLKHVDDFGAARNLSFELAGKGNGNLTGGNGGNREPAKINWLLWLDCDDYLDELNCRRIREAVRTAPADWNGIFCSYRIEAQGGVIPRERLIRVLPGRGPAGSWKNPVHETCVIDGPAGQCPQIEIFHSDHSAKHQSSAARNATILERVIEDAPRHYFHLHAEYKMMGRKEEAANAGRAALELLGEGQVEELYMVRLNLSELDPEKTVEHLIEAVRLQPHRREAFAYLCQKSLIDGNLSDAISYFRLMDSLPLPSPLPWTHQGLWYGWARNFLRVRVLRASRRLDLSEKEHAEHLKEPEYAAGVAEFESRKTITEGNEGNEEQKP